MSEEAQTRAGRPENAGQNSVEMYWNLQQIFLILLINSNVLNYFFFLFVDFFRPKMN